jgi:replicative DNA helicase
MPATRIMERALALQGRARIDDLRRGTFGDGAGDGPATAAAVLRGGRPVLAQLPDTGTAGVSDFLVEHLGLELVVVDSLQYVATGPRGLDDELAAAARALKELAMRRSTSVLVVTHLARSLRDRPNPRPQLDDFGGYGAIRQQADVVLGLFREELYADSPHVEGAAELHVLKNRNGPVGFVDLYFYKQWMRFEDMVEPDA